MLLLLLLVLSSVSLQDAVKHRSLDENDPSMIPGLENQKPKITANISTTRHILPLKSRTKRQVNSFPSSSGDNGNLKWKKWEGVLPEGSVSINNQYTNRIDHVCKVGCDSGFFNIYLGPTCHYPKKGSGLRSSSFEILVNEDDFEFLEWKEGYAGSLPKDSIKTCSSEEMYVAKHRYGLGKVDLKNRCFYYYWGQIQYWEWDYEVLTIRLNAEHETISDVKYISDQARVYNSHPVTLEKFAVVNSGCQPVKKTSTLTRKTHETKTWDVTFPLMAGVDKTIQTGIPDVVNGSVEVTPEKTFPYSQGGSLTEESSHTVSLELTIPPIHRCKISVVGSKYNVDVPFTARLSRRYGHWDTRRTTINGTYHGVQTGDIHAQVERCEPLPDARPCSVFDLFE